MKKNILIFARATSGHYIEYIRHIYEKAAGDGNSYTIVVPEDFKEKSRKLAWKECGNIDFIFTPPELDSALKRVRFLSKTCRAKNIDEVFCISLMDLMPSIAFLLPRGVKISGIIYAIYLFSWKKSSFKTKILNIIKYLLFSKISAFKNVYILNSESAADRLCRLYGSKKFKSVADPIFIEKSGKPGIGKEAFGIPQNAKIFLHFGGLDRRKGTIEILDAIPRLGKEILNRSFFVFAGKVYGGIKKEFYEKLDKALKSGANIKVYDEFCDYEFLSDIVSVSDAILVPYFNVNQSSGCLSYAASFEKPLIAPKSGLLGHLVKKYNLGLLMEKNSPACVKSAIEEFCAGEGPGERRFKEYALANSVESFQKTVFEGFE